MGDKSLDDLVKRGTEEIMDELKEEIILERLEQRERNREEFRRDQTDKQRRFKMIEKEQFDRRVEVESKKLAEERKHREEVAVKTLEAEKALEILNERRWEHFMLQVTKGINEAINNEVER